MHARPSKTLSLALALLAASPAGATTTITQVTTGSTQTLDMATDGANKWPAHLIWDGTNWACVNGDSGLCVHIVNFPTAFGISGSLPAFASTPTVNLGTLNGAATAAGQSTEHTDLAAILTAVQGAIPAGTATIGKMGLLASDASAALDSAAGTPGSRVLNVQGNANGVPTPVTMTPQATGGRSSGVAATLTTPVVIKASAGTISAIHCDNTAGTTTAYAQILNTASSPALGANVIWFVTMAGGQPGTIVFDSAGLAASTGISIGLATTPNGAVAYATAGACAVEYK